MTPVTVLGLRVENVKRIKALSINPPATGLVKVAGRNEQGKSSALDAIMFALGGAERVPEMPLRKGATRARVLVTLGNLEVERKWTEGGSYLEVTREGKPLRRPQEFLDALTGAGLGFDPLEFLRMKSPTQVETLLGLLRLPEDPRAIEHEKRALYDERTLVNRQLRQVQARLAELTPPVPDTPDEEVSVSELVQEHERMLEIRRANDEARAARAAAASECERAQAEVQRVTDLLESARTVLQAATQRYETLLVQTLDLEDPDPSEISAKMRHLEEENRRVRAKRLRTQTEQEVARIEAQTTQLTERIQALDGRKRTLLTEATFPVAGLGFSEVNGSWVVTYDALPLEQVAHSVQLRVAVAITMALNPQCRIILIRDGSTLDEDNTALLQAMAAERNFQVWLELVGDGDLDSFVIEDGGVLRRPEGVHG